MKFDDLLDLKEIKSFLKEEGIKKLTEVQNKAMPILLKQDAVDVLAPTGSGKTLAYVMPLAAMIKEKEAIFGGILPTPTAIVLAPTRELSSQISRVFKRMSHHLRLRVKMVKPGENTKTMKMWNSSDVIVGPPGRVLWAIKHKFIDVTACEFFILDEADQLLDKSFSTEVRSIFKLLHTQNVALFSATLPEDIVNVRQEVFSKIKFKQMYIGDHHKVSTFVETFNIKVMFSEKLEMTKTFLKREVLVPGIIFVNRKEDVNKIFDALSEYFPRRRFFALHGGIDKKVREKTYRAFIKERGVMVCTDIAARGIDIKELAWVLNYDLPSVAVYYLHRCGRVARGGVKNGIVYNMITPRDSEAIQEINDSIKKESSLNLKSISSFQKTKKKDTSKTGKGSARGAKRTFKKSPRFKRRRDD